MIAALSEVIFKVFLPEKWFGASNYLQYMCIASLLYPLHSANLNILKVKGRSDLFLYLEVIKKSLVIFLLYLSYPFGVEGMLIGQICTSVIAYIPNSYFAMKLVSYGPSEQMLDFTPALILSVVLGLIAFTITKSGLITGFYTMAILIIVYVLLYIAISLLFDIEALRMVNIIISSFWDRY